MSRAGGAVRRIVHRYIPSLSTKSRQTPGFLSASQRKFLRHYSPRFGPRLPARIQYKNYQNPSGLWQTSPAFRTVIYGGVGLTVAFVAINLEKTPISGRWRFNWVSPEMEIQESQQAYNDILRQYRGAILPQNSRETQLVRRVVSRLLQNIDFGQKQLNVQWEVNVIASKEVNAFVLPGGKIFVFTGILPYAQTEDGLAGILGHEISHTLAGHVGEKMSLNYLLLPWSWVLALLTGSPPGGFQALFSLGLSNPGSRSQEAEADNIGLMIMAKACYDVDEMPRYWERMHEYERRNGAPPQFLSTHPSSSNRVKRIEDAIPAAKELAAQSGCQGTADRMSMFRSTFGGSLDQQRRGQFGRPRSVGVKTGPGPGPRHEQDGFVNDDDGFD